MRDTEMWFGRTVRCSDSHRDTGAERETSPSSCYAEIAWARPMKFAWGQAISRPTAAAVGTMVGGLAARVIGGVVGGLLTPTNLGEDHDELAERDALIRRNLKEHGTPYYQPPRHP